MEEIFQHSRGDIQATPKACYYFNVDLDCWGNSLGFTGAFVVAMTTLVVRNFI